MVLTTHRVWLLFFRYDSVPAQIATILGYLSVERLAPPSFRHHHRPVAGGAPGSTTLTRSNSVQGMIGTSSHARAETPPFAIHRLESSKASRRQKSVLYSFPLLLRRSILLGGKQVEAKPALLAETEARRVKAEAESIQCTLWFPVNTSFIAGEAQRYSLQKL